MLAKWAEEATAAPRLFFFRSHFTPFTLSDRDFYTFARSSHAVTTFPASGRKAKMGSLALGLLRDLIIRDSVRVGWAMGGKVVLQIAAGACLRK